MHCCSPDFRHITWSWSSALTLDRCVGSMLMAGPHATSSPTWWLMFVRYGRKWTACSWKFWIRIFYCTCQHCSLARRHGVSISNSGDPANRIWTMTYWGQWTRRVSSSLNLVLCWDTLCMYTWYISNWIYLLCIWCYTPDIFFVFEATSQYLDGLSWQATGNVTRKGTLVWAILPKWHHFKLFERW